ncbi:hypothetical protein TIFTF001_023701 [Ficus carica]|uniref:Uncharacterized protein n=1 Tax=Ficus carica TaxID=3494 RepID=A0AA88AKY0_FICCA|nr:hypothetical protein TIFTF001_023701 [Ficus carica]
MPKIPLPTISFPAIQASFTRKNGDICGAKRKNDNLYEANPIILADLDVARTPTNARNQQNSISVGLQTHHEISKELCLLSANGPPPIGCRPSLTRAMAIGPPISESPPIAQLVPWPAIAQRSRRRSLTGHHSKARVL